MAASMADLRANPAPRRPLSTRRKITTTAAAAPSLRRGLTLELPDRLKEANDDEGDTAEDVTAPRTNSQARFMNQSIFSMITAAGSNADFQSRFDEGSSDSEGHADEEEGARMAKTVGALPAVSLARGRGKGGGPASLDGVVDRETGSSRRNILQRLKLKPIRERKGLARGEESMMSSQILARPKPQDVHEEEEEDAVPSDDLILSRQLQAEADMEVSDEEEDEEDSAQGPAAPMSPRRTQVSLSHKLMEIFRFESPEEVIAEWKCWLLQSVLLMGYMYVTQKHICFYAYLPKKASTIAYSGYITKRGKRNPRYRKYFFELKGDVLSYYDSPAKKYYPNGNIDLRKGISAAVADPLDKSRDETYFSITSEDRQHHFKAESADVAKAWVKHLQKAIFRCHNESDAVKISLPLENVMDIEETPILDCAEAVKIRVIDNDETYAIDEYFFSFFDPSQNAARLLRTMIEENSLHQISKQKGNEDDEDDEQDSQQPGSGSSDSDRRPGFPRRKPKLREHVREELSPRGPISRNMSISRRSSDSLAQSPRARRRSSGSGQSADRHRSSSFDRAMGRASARQSRRAPDATESPRTESQYPETDSSAAFQSFDDSTASAASASQILNSSDVFHRSTLQEPRRDSADRGPRGSQDTARSADVKQDGELSTRKSKDLAQKRDSAGSRPAGSLDAASYGQSSSQIPSWALKGMVRAGAYPLQRASGFANYIRDSSKKMTNLLATESMGYMEKVSDMWVGGGRHYSTTDGLNPDDQVRDADDDEDAANAANRFREHFKLSPNEQLIATWYTYFHRVLPLYGKVYLGSRHLCYRSLLPGTRTKLVVPLKDIEAANKEKGYRLGYCALVVVIRGHEEIFFDFGAVGTRDDCAITLILSMEGARKNLQESGLLTEEEAQSAEAAKAEYDSLQPDDEGGREEVHESVMLQDPRTITLNVKPPASMRVTCLTIGSRGDVQPYIALCKGLLAEGHKPRIATHKEFEPWIRSHGIDFAAVGGDPAELMRICVENGMFTYSFLREASGKFRGWLDELMVSAWEAAQGSDLLIESPSAMAGIHIAEALGIPYFRAFTMPWTRTRAYPHAFAVPEYKMGGAYNYMSYVMFDTLFWKAIAGQVNRWRKRTLGLGATNLDRMAVNKVPFLYNFSPSVVAPPLDYSDWIRVTGYWFLDEGNTYTPPKELADFIAQARKDGKKLVYVGFGSIVVEDPAALTKTVVDSVLKADVRCILSKGWSDRLGGTATTTTTTTTTTATTTTGNPPTKTTTPQQPEPLPSCIHQIASAPHDWLFAQMDAAAHHGGAGTTGASLRAGIPTIAKPFFGDQFFFGQRIEDLGVGICLKKLNTAVFARALWRATHEARIVERARALGEQIRREDGVANAIQALYRDLEYSRGLARREGKEAPTTKYKNAGGEGGALGGGIGEAEAEETWTFVGEESDEEMVRLKVGVTEERGVGKR